MSNSDSLLSPDIVRVLDTRVIGKKNIFHYREIDSTNARARDLADQGAPEGTLVMAEKQTRGRGSKGRTWFSPSVGGIYASLILRPSLLSKEAPQITFLTAVAAAEAIRGCTQLHVRIKWPNDLLVNGKKLAGILTEIHADREVLRYAVAGIGINVNIPGFPPEISGTATSLLIETGRRFPRADVLRAFLREEENRLIQLRTEGFSPILGRWKELADTIGRPIRVEMADTSFEGWAEDVDPEGVLILRDRKGFFHRILSGDVVLL